MEHFTRSLLRPERTLEDKVKLDGALNLKAVPKLQELSKPPPAPRPRERLPVKPKEDRAESERPDSDTESICSLPSKCSKLSGSEGHGFPAVLSCEILEEKQKNWWRPAEEDLNLISIGDGDAERAASLRLQAPERKGSFGEERQRVKSVKLIELPTCQQLIVQHEMLQVRLPDVTAFLGCLDLKSRFPSSSSPGKAAGPTLVHFGRPTGMLVSPTTPVRETQVVASPHRAVGGQLPPLSGPGKAGEAELSPSREKESGEASTVPTDRPLSSRAGELGLGAPIETENLGIQRGTPSNQSPPGIWKVQGVGSGRDGRTLFSAHKKRPVLASVGVGGRPPGSVWRDHVAAGKGF
ncbi:unnamed protein product [Durusdinium trenchii]|uniref:Uncharacterized protein n=1 Tax=Durusdinium trenchii TaxID=1381693 RepID=A0ABP0SSR2_9DINO